MEPVRQAEALGQIAIGDRRLLVEQQPDDLLAPGRELRHGLRGSPVRARPPRPGRAVWRPALHLRLFDVRQLVLGAAPPLPLPVERQVRGDGNQPAGAAPPSCADAAARRTARGRPAERCPPRPPASPRISSVSSRSGSCTWQSAPPTPARRRAGTQRPGGCRSTSRPAHSGPPDRLSRQNSSSTFHSAWCSRIVGRKFPSPFFAPTRMFGLTSDTIGRFSRTSACTRS